ncbi:MAG: hypothetical protein ABH862_05460 [Candidatus Omnitrophota bacterium]
MSPSISEEKRKRSYEKAYKGSVELLKSLLDDTEKRSIGFFASSVDRENYKRLFSRDAFWIGIAALLTGEKVLVEGFRQSLDTLGCRQRDDGAIPSNVTQDGKVSYGVINPRIDSTTLFVLGALFYRKVNKIKRKDDLYIESIHRAMSYLAEHWENPDTNLLYIPRAGNWADEYFQQGYVLYDEVLWYYALKEYGNMLKGHRDERSKLFIKKAGKVFKFIRDRFWIKLLKEDGSDHMRKIVRVFDLDKVGYFLHYYHVENRMDKGMGHPHRVFDAFGNILALLSGMASSEQSKKIRNFVDNISMNYYPLIPAHYPFVREKFFKTYKLYQYRFKEYVGHYHNGGLWPWYTGLYVSYLAKIGDRKRALKYLDGIYNANTMKDDGMDYFEYHMNKAASVKTIVRHRDGIGLFMSMIMKNIVLDRKSMVLIKYKRKKEDLSDDMAVRALKIPEGAEIKITAVGPDAEFVLEDIMELSDKETNCLEESRIAMKRNKPYGIPRLGVSAAAYIIAYKAVFGKKIIFK